MEALVEGLVALVEIALEHEAVEEPERRAEDQHAQPDDDHCGLQRGVGRGGLSSVRRGGSRYGFCASAQPTTTATTASAEVTRAGP